jgi:hypothetical protein
VKSDPATPLPGPDPGPLHAELGSTGRRWIEIFTVAILFSFALTLGILGNRIGSTDLDQFLVFHELQYWNSQLFDGSKQWCPLMCSGLSLAAEPQVPVLSLSMLLGYVTDPMWGIRLAMLIYLGLGWLGTFLYSGLWLPQRLQRSLAASLFIGNGFFICRLGHGHVDFLAFCILPLVLYFLHRVVVWSREARSLRDWMRPAAATLLLAAGISLAIDGSPVVILHVLFWIGLYGAVLAWVSRSLAPLVMLAGMLGMAAILDAAYLWPMVTGQSEAPRLTPDQFTNPLALPWFMMVPIWGKFFLSANGKGHELSVFIGPVLAWLVWRYRRPLFTGLPAVLKVPLLFVGIVSFWLGMGSLKPVHVPAALSLFDLLRPLPGMRSMGVTGRYWGFFALPLSLLCAGGLWCFLAERARGLRVWICLGLALFIQLGFQTTALLSRYALGRPYQAVDWKGEFQEEETGVQFVQRGERSQGEILTPTRAVIDCYNNDDIPRAEVMPGNRLVLAALRGRSSPLEDAEVRGGFVTWSRIRLRLVSPATPSGPASPDGEIEILLNQAYHRFWSSPDGEVVRGSGNRIAFRCAESRLRAGPVELAFHDPVSARGKRVSSYAWGVWGALLAAAALLFGLARPAADRSGR